MDLKELCLFLTIFVAFMAPFLDFKFKKVPTWLTLPALAVGIGIASAQGWQSLSFTSIGNEINLSQTLISLSFVLVLFGPLTWKGGFSKEDLLLLLALVSFNTFGSSMSIIFLTTASGFLIAIFYLTYKGILGQGIIAALRTLTFQAKKRDEDGKLDNIHKITIPYSPAVSFGVLLWFCGEAGLGVFPW
jgi:hypothetical protein